MVSARTTALPLALFALLLASPARAEHRVWRVRSGDALSVLAQRFGVSVEQLEQWNTLHDDRIYVGQELVVQPDTPGGTAPAAGVYEVAAGDTLSAVALRFGVTIEDLSRWNPALEPDHIQAGQRLHLGPERRHISYRVRRGDSLSLVAARYGVAVRDLLSWNRGLSRDHLRIDRELTLYSERPLSLSESVGSPSQGRLEHAVRLRRHPGYVIRDRDQAWGTQETVDWLVEAFDAVRKKHGLARRVRVHDISHREGGFMAGHLSHQTGRDVDLSYYQRHCGGEPCRMGRLDPANIDAPRQWTLLHHILEHGRAQAVFVDYALQAPLYRRARAEGATREQLNRWFQYPRGRGFPLGIIRHFRGHRDHLHVRFVCPDTDERCR